MNKAVTIFMSIVALVAIAVIGVDTMLQLEQFNVKKHTYQTGIYEVCNNQNAGYTKRITRYSIQSRHTYRRW